MCYAYTSVTMQIQQLEGTLTRLRDDMSHCDRSLANFYHGVEAKKFNASEGYYIAKDLQDILLKRRKVKFEVHQIKSLLDQLKTVDRKLKLNERKFQKNNPNWERIIHME